MRVIKENYKNFPDKLTNVATSVEGQALEDTEVFDKRKEETEKEIEKNAKLPVDGAPKAIKPEAVKIPNKLTEGRKVLGVERMPNDPTTNAEVDEYFNMIYEAIPNFEDELIFRLQSKLGNSNFFDLLIDLFGDEVEPPELEESFMSGAQKNGDKTFNEEYLNENINEEDAARIVQEVIGNSFGIDAEVEVYKDKAKSKSVVVQFIISKAENKKLVYDEFKDELKKRFGDDINISCKTFSSPNLAERKVEYKIKVLVIKEKKDKYGAVKAAEKQKRDRERATGKAWYKSLNEKIEKTQPYFWAEFSDATLVKLGVISEEQAQKLPTSKKKVAMRDWVNNNFAVHVPTDFDDLARDGGKGIQYDPSTGLYACDIIGTEEDLKDFMDATGIKGTIGLTWGEADWLAAKEASEPVDNLFELLWNDLAADTDHEYRRLKAPNSIRYQAENSTTALDDNGADVELAIADDGENIKITPKGTVQGTDTPKDFTIAEAVEEAYADYGVKFKRMGKDKSGNEYGIMIVPDGYTEEDIMEHEKQYKKNKRAQKKAEKNAASTPVDED